MEKENSVHEDTSSEVMAIPVGHHELPPLLHLQCT